MRSWCQVVFGCAFVVVVAVAMGCSHPSHETLQWSVAPRKLSCDQKQITAKPLAGDTRIFTGCGREVWMTCASFSTGEQCFPMQDLRARAAFEMGCEDKASLTFAALDASGHTVGVTACSKRIIYQYVQTEAWNYNWVATSSSVSERTGTN
jgi:hypothetical protein